MTPAELDALRDIRTRVRRLSAVSRLYPGAFVEDQDEIIRAIDGLMGAVPVRRERRPVGRPRIVRERFQVDGRTFEVVRKRAAFALG